MSRCALLCGLVLSITSCGRRDQGSPATAGRQVDVGGHRLEVVVEGDDRGRPTVVLESGLGGDIQHWAVVRQALSQDTRVVSYCRAGIGGSQPGPRPRSAERIVTELRAALDALDTEPPYVLVGHSIGGLYVRAYAILHPDEVDGIVLVDPTMEFPESLSRPKMDLLLQQHWGPDFERIGRLLDRIHPRMATIAAQSILQLEPYLKQVPVTERAATRAQWLDRFTDRAQQIEGMLGLMSDAERQELFGSVQSMQMVREATATSVPVHLLVAGNTATQARAEKANRNTTLSADYIARSQRVRRERFATFIETLPHGKLEIVKDSGHNIPADRPDAIIAAVRALIAK